MKVYEINWQRITVFVAIENFVLKQTLRNVTRSTHLKESSNEYKGLKHFRRRIMEMLSKQMAENTLLAS